MRKHKWPIRLETALTILGVTCLAYYLWVQHEAYEAQTQAKRCVRQMNLARQCEPIAPNASHSRLHHGDVVCELKIPRLRLSVMVFEGDDSSILRLGAGHIPETALPETGGNVGIAAHRDTYFRCLRLIRPSDVIALKTATGIFRYAVTRTEVVPPSDAGVLARMPDRDLTLVTCYPFYIVGSAPERFIVYAKRSL